MTTSQRTMPRPAYPPGWLVGQLPVGMRDDDMLVRFTTIFERLGASLREGADTVEHAADPTVAAPGMLAYLGRWLGYDLVDAELDVVRQREIIAALGRALPMRGTRVGLERILRAVTGGPVVIEEPGWVRGVAGEGQPDAVTPVVIRVASAGHLREHELEALVRDEVPAHLPVTLVFDPDLRTEAP